jgi:DNA transposase THAP9
MSQHHLEMLFSAIRSRGGFNNNPIASQFEATYKRLLVHTELSVSTDVNCDSQDSTCILHISKGKKAIRKNFLDILCVEEEES